MAETSSESAASPPQGFPTPVNLPLVYFNGYGMLNSADIGCVLLLDNQPQLRLAMSLAVAKSLANSLSNSIANYERAIGAQVPDLNEVVQKLRLAADTTS